MLILGSLSVLTISQMRTPLYGQSTKSSASRRTQPRGVVLTGGEDQNGAVRAERRVALVIGNSRYKDAPLPNPANDAKDMSDALRKLGFDVTAYTDTSRADMMRAIEKFGQALRRGAVGLFYFAGHAMQVNGVNYLIPVDAQINTEVDVEVESVDANRVLNAMRTAGNRLNIVILDACRNNPFARSSRSATRGLAEMQAPTGTLIAYATAPGRTASDGNRRNGLYTQELVEALRTPGLKVEDVFKRVRIHVLEKSGRTQEPWEHSSLIGDFYFIPPSGAPVNTEPPPRYPVSVTPSSSIPSAELRAPAGITKTISFNVQDGWTNTFLNVPQSAQIEIRASGQVDLGRYGMADPAGTERPDEKRPMKNCPTGALIARVGQSDPICIQRSHKFTAQSAGVLYLGFNSANPKGNRGSVVANINID